MKIAIYKMILVLLASNVFSTSSAFACSCLASSPAVELARSDAVFTGSVVSLELLEGADPAVRIEMRVIERIKGSVSGRVILYMRARAPLLPPVSSFVVDPVTDGISGSSGWGVGSACEVNDMFALGSDYVVSAFLNSPKGPFSVNRPDATLVTHFCAATKQVDSDIGKIYLTGFREAAKASQ